MIQIQIDPTKDVENGIPTMTGYVIYNIAARKQREKEAREKKYEDDRRVFVEMYAPYSRQTS
jgi:hypothetical protein